MSSPRKIVFRDNYFYHVFNRGIEKRVVFRGKTEYTRAKLLMNYYSFNHTIRFSYFQELSDERKEDYLNSLDQNQKIIDIICYCLMPNHFHFLLKQNQENGISSFISKWTNAYTKYFNTKSKRVGPLFQGVFKAVFVEDDEQLIHLSRYIHLNPVASSIINQNELENYTWSSYYEYIHSTPETTILKNPVLQNFKSISEYKKFVEDHIHHAKQLELVKHLTIE